MNSKRRATLSRRYDPTTQETVEECNELKTEPSQAGGGKSWSLLAYLLRFCDDPETYIVCFRKSLKQMQRALFKEAKSLYRPLITDNKGNYIGKAKITDSQGNYKVVFPSGATIEFSYLTCEKDAIDGYQGAELTGAIFDEF